MYVLRMALFFIIYFELPQVAEHSEVDNNAHFYSHYISQQNEIVTLLIRHVSTLNMSGVKILFQFCLIDLSVFVSRLVGIQRITLFSSD